MQVPIHTAFTQVQRWPTYKFENWQVQIKTLVMDLIFCNLSAVWITFYNSSIQQVQHCNELLSISLKLKTA